MSSSLQSLLSKKSTYETQELPVGIFFGVFSGFKLLQSSKEDSKAEGLACQWSLTVPTSTGGTTTRTISENFWLIGKDGTPLPYGPQSLTRRLLSFQSHAEGYIREGKFQFAVYSAGDNDEDGILHSRKKFNVTLEKDSAGYVHVKKADPSSKLKRTIEPVRERQSKRRHTKGKVSRPRETTLGSEEENEEEEEEALMNQYIMPEQLKPFDGEDGSQQFKY